jgi:hypothetical protein
VRVSALRSRSLNHRLNSPLDVTRANAICFPSGESVTPSNCRAGEPTFANSLPDRSSHASWLSGRLFARYTSVPVSLTEAAIWGGVPVNETCLCESRGITGELERSRVEGLRHQVSFAEEQKQSLISASPGRDEDRTRKVRQQPPADGFAQ